ncbi:hypothetical protein AX16_001047 [Volvariella volvacea WC 439]|nr:hypothetical protein AX16_001047 [Volvariella volvacea WC 439]
MKDPATLSFDDPHSYMDSDQMIFGPIDMEDTTTTYREPVVPYSWDPFGDPDAEMKPTYPFPTSPVMPMSPYSFGVSHSSPPDSYYDPNPMDEPKSPHFDNGSYLSHWINDSEVSYIPSSPIPIPSSIASTSQSQSFVAYNDHTSFPSGAFSPTTFAAMHPLPRSVSPSSSFDDRVQHFQQPSINSVSPQDMSLQAPGWATSLWDGPSSLRSPSAVRPSVRHSPLTDSTIRPRVPVRRGSITSAHLFQSASAPSASEPRVPAMTRSYSRRAESVSINEDRDATVRRKKRSPAAEDIKVPDGKDKDKDKSGDIPLKSVLRPPKLAPSAWQLYFTDWIQRQQATSTRKLNVAQAAKEAGQEYASLSQEEKEPYKRRSQAAKEDREKELAAYMKSLTPEDIKRENAFRAAQRKAGKSRKSNIKDPNAPKKPLSAYFMFLQKIRADPRLVQDIFGDETETTKQSVLAAAKWRSMTDAERQPFLAQAEQEKMEYEAARRLYEEGTTGYGNSINFSILPGSPAFQTIIKTESESESEGFNTDSEHPTRR